VQGYRRLIDFLAGGEFRYILVFASRLELSASGKGDYDGDMATVYWDLEMVRHFRNANNKFSVEPPGLAACFSSTDGNEKVQEFVERTAAWSPSERTLVMQTYLLGALRDTSVVGKYSSMHDNAIYSLGYSNPRTVKLAYKYVFPTVEKLDANIEFLFFEVLQGSRWSKDGTQD